MVDHDDEINMDETTAFGYIKARLEDISRVQGEQRQEIQEVRADVASLRVEIGALKATARAWGVMTDFDNNTFEHDYIIRILESFAFDLRERVSRGIVSQAEIIDRYAVQLTAFMRGEVRQAVRGAQERHVGPVGG
jgi:hypothetical protein